MIVSETASRVTSRWLQACVLLCVAVVLPVGITYAQDYEAVGKRLRAAVEAGELTGEQARAMLGALRETAEHEGDRNAGVEDERVAKYRGIAARIKATVEAGKMSKEDAEKKLIAIRMEMWPPYKDGDEDEDDAGDEQEDEGIKLVPAEVARGIGKALLEAAPMNFAGDPSQAVGVFAEDDEEGMLGMILVPVEGLNEEEAEMEVGDSAPLALLFTSAPILPAADGRLIDRGRLHSVTITDDEGHEHDSNCMMLIVKRIAEEDYRLYGIGKNANEPLIDGRFDDGEGPGQTPLALEVKDIDEESETAAVVITVFNKYQAAFRAGVAE